MPNYIWWSNKIWERFWKMYYMHILKMITFMKWSGYFSIFGFHNFRTKWNCGVLSSEIVLAIPMPNVNLLFRHLITKMQVWGNHVLVKFRYRWNGRKIVPTRVHAYGASVVAGLLICSVMAQPFIIDLIIRKRV